MKRENLKIRVGFLLRNVVCCIAISMGVLGFPLAGHAGGVVVNFTESDLTNALAGGGTVTFACNGTITVASTKTITTNTTLDASGHAVTISGGNTVRVFTVNSNISFTLINLLVANGTSLN